jgi:hypothetical protein
MGSIRPVKPGKEKKVETNLSIEKKEIKFIRDYLSGKTKPVELDEVAYQIALFKTRIVSIK